MKLIAAGSLALAMLAASTPVSAQARRGEGASARERTRGLMLSAQALVVPGVSIEGEDVEGEIETELGGGLGLRVGYGFTPMFMAFLGADLVRQGSGVEGLEGDFGLAHLELGGRANFYLAGAPVLPYVTVAVGGRGLGAEVEEDGDEFDLSLSGGMVSVGGGVQYFVSPKLALDGGVSVGVGKFDNIEIDDEDDDIEVDNTTTLRFRAGVNWYP